MGLDRECFMPHNPATIAHPDQHGAYHTYLMGTNSFAIHCPHGGFIVSGCVCSCCGGEISILNSFVAGVLLWPDNFVHKLPNTMIVEK